MRREEVDQRCPKRRLPRHSSIMRRWRSKSFLQASFAHATSPSLSIREITVTSISHIIWPLWYTMTSTTVLTFEHHSSYGCSERLYLRIRAHEQSSMVPLLYATTHSHKYCQMLDTCTLHKRMQAKDYFIITRGWRDVDAVADERSRDHFCSGTVTEHINDCSSMRPGMIQL